MFLSLERGYQSMKNSPLKIGHRGCGKGYGENTALSIHLGLLAGADGIEYDVREAKDGTIVLIHDDTIDRTTTGAGKVSDYTYAELRQFNAGYKESIPLLENICSLRRHCFHNIELKEAIGEEVLPIITKYLHPDQVIISSFNWDDLALFVPTEIHTALLADEEKVQDMGDYGFITEAVHRGATAINPHFTAATPSLVELAHKHGLQVYVWTVNEPKDIARMKKIGVDGIISDFVERL